MHIQGLDYVKYLRDRSRLLWANEDSRPATIASKPDSLERSGSIRGQKSNPDPQSEPPT